MTDQTSLKAKVAKLLQRLEEQPQDFQDCVSIRDSLHDVVKDVEHLNGGEIIVDKYKPGN